MVEKGLSILYLNAIVGSIVNIKMIERAFQSKLHESKESLSNSKKKIGSTIRPAESELLQEIHDALVEIEDDVYSMSSTTSKIMSLTDDYLSEFNKSIENPKRQYDNDVSKIRNETLNLSEMYINCEVSIASLNSKALYASERLRQDVSKLNAEFIANCASELSSLLTQIDLVVKTLEGSVEYLCNIMSN